MKKGKSYLKLLGALILGGVIGGCTSMAIFWNYDGLVQMAKGADGFFRETGIAIEAVVVLVFAAVVTGIYLYARSLWKKERTAEDEMADVYGEKFETWSQIGLITSEVAAGCIIILGFLFTPIHGLEVSRTEIYYLWVTAVMLGGAIYMAIIEIMYYHLIQKHDPKKKGDPASLSFNKKWLASCDETEKLVIYQAAYKGFSGMQILLLIGIVLAGIGKFSFNTGNFPILLLGAVWITGNMIFGIWKMKGLGTIQ